MYLRDCLPDSVLIFFKNFTERALFYLQLRVWIVLKSVQQFFALSVRYITHLGNSLKVTQTGNSEYEL